jgi:3-oxoacyl-[acyl-carrier protein] reductase
MSENDWDLIMNVLLKGTFLCCRAVAPIMVKQGHGVIVNMSSRFGATGGIKMAHYSAAKAGVLALTKSLALELAPYRIRVNAVAPGAVNTPMFRSNRTEAEINEFPSRIPLGRLGDPKDIAAAVSFLVGPESDYMTGQTLHVNGGNFML